MIRPIYLHQMDHHRIRNPLHSMNTSSISIGALKILHDAIHIKDIYKEKNSGLFIRMKFTWFNANVIILLEINYVSYDLMQFEFQRSVSSQ